MKSAVEPEGCFGMGWGEPCPHFINEKSTLPCWPSTLPFPEHQNVEKNSIFDVFC